MIRLKSTLCSDNVRKTGITLTCVSTLLQAGTIIIIITLYCFSNRDYYGWIRPGLFGDDWFHSEELRNLFIAGLFFLSVDILLYILLIYGLVKEKVAALTVWLTFSVIEMILVQAPLMVISFLWTINVNPGIGILSLIAQAAVGVYMFYHSSVVYTVRSDILDRKLPIHTNTGYPQHNANMLSANSSNVVQPVQIGIGVPHYTTQPQPLIVPAATSTVYQQNLPSAVPEQKMLPPAYQFNH